MPSKRALARGGARIAAGVVGIAVAAATIGAASVLTLPNFEVRPPAQKVTPVPADQQRVCPGPLVQLAADSSASSASTFGGPQLTVGSSDPSVERSTLKPVDTHSDDSPTSLTAHAAGAETLPLLAGAQSQVATQDEITGLAVAACGEAAGDAWLAAGATTLGQTSLVLLSNPTKVQATVDLEVYAESGMISAPGAQGIVVEPGTQRIVPLAGIAPNVQAPIVHVQATGGRVAASLQQSVVRGLQPAGVELTGPTNGPGQRQVISGLLVANAAAAQQGGGAESGSALLPAVRVLVPGSAGASVSVSVRGENGVVAGTATTATVPGNTVQDLPLNDLTDGSYTVTVTANRPIVAAARSISRSNDGEDFAWFAASPGLDDTALAAVAAGPGAALHLANVSGTDATVRLKSRGGDTATVKVPAHGGASTPVVQGVWTLTGARGIVASVGYNAPGRLSSYPIEPPGALALAITVYPR